MEKPSVCVVMSTYNGEKYIRPQIESILNQIDIRLILYIRDDGSKDNTKEIIEEYISDNVIFDIGENLGAKKSFIEALQEAPVADYYAFSDQDDVWDRDKLIAAIAMIRNREKKGVPILYCGRTRLVDSKLNYIGEGRCYHEKSNSFLCGEVQAAAGCTMVFSRELKQKIEQYSPIVYPMHDAWVSNLCLALGGEIVYDNSMHINYRQHDNNAVGGSKGLISSIKRRIMFYKKMGPNYHTKMYKEIVEAYENEMPKDNVDRYKWVCSYRSSLKNKIGLLRDKCFWNGRNRWRFETLLLVVFNKY